jgi:glycosyltransferase involved in cell wall biosynthesis
MGGPGTFCAELADSLGNSGIDVTVLTGSPGRLPRLRTDRRGRVNVVRVPRIDIPPNYLWFQLMNQNALKKILHNVDIVHGQDTSSFPTIYLARRSARRMPWVVTVHACPVSHMKYTAHSMRHGGSMYEFVQAVIGFPVWDTILRGDMKFADAIIPVAKHLSKELRESKYTTNSRLLTIHNGMNIQRIIETAESGATPPVSNRIRMFWSGRCVWVKGILQLLESLQILKERFRFDNFEINMFGRGPLDRTISQLVLRFGLEQNVRLRGFVAHNDLLVWLASSDLVCFPSLSESLPMALIEAMALGKPIVAFDKPFAREAMGEHVGLPFARSIDHFARNLYRLCTDEHLRKRVGRALQQRARIEFDINIIARKYAKVYSTLVN